MTDEQPTVEYELAPESSNHRFAWIAAALALMLALGTGVWGWTAQRGMSTARAAVSAAMAERDRAVTEAQQWRSLLDQAETAAQSTDAKVAELEQRVQSLDELLQTANMEVSRLESELAAATTDVAISEEPPEATVTVTTLPEAGGSLGTVAPAPAAVAAIEPAAAPPAAVAATPVAAPAPAPAPLVVAAAPAGTPAQTLAIAFDVNSSYLPESLDGRLRTLAGELQPGESYLIELVGSVGHPDVEGQSAEEALRYNRWMADRRMSRVAEFLQKNAKAEKLTFRKDFALNDPTRRVLVEIRPAQE